MQKNQKNRKKVTWIIVIAALVVALIGAAVCIYFVAGPGHSNHGSLKEDEIVFYTPAPGSIQHDEETGTDYVNNMLIINFEKGTSRKQREQIISGLGGKVAGQFPQLNQIQLEIKAADLNTLKAICGELRGNQHIRSVFYDTVFDVAPESVVPEDPWQPDTKWDEAHPDGDNWWLEAVNAPSAWEYRDQLSRAQIGIVDSGFDFDHEDFGNTLVRPPWVFEPTVYLDDEIDEETKKAMEDDVSHGTHVAGIIGAKANNHKGITGLVPHSSIMTYDWPLYYDDGGKIRVDCTTSRIVSGVAYCIVGGAKVINVSAGTYYEDWEEYLRTAVACSDDSAAMAFDCLASLLDNGYDFVIVQSAGNGVAFDTATDSKGNQVNINRSADAVYNGLFASISRDKNYGTKQNASVKEVTDRIIVVGAAMMTEDGQFMQPYWSNAGSRVDICAPGTAIYSTLPGNQYGYMSGTSMAAPIVTGTAAMTWAANPALTGAEVKAMVCDPANTIYTVQDNPDPMHPMKDSYPMVNTELSVRAALASKGTNPEETHDSDHTPETTSRDCTFDINDPIIILMDQTVQYDGKTYHWLIPGFNCDSEEIQKFNNNMLSNYISELENYKSDPHHADVSYKTYYYEPFFTICYTGNTIYDEEFEACYTINQETGKLVSNEEMLEFLHIDQEEFLANARQSALLQMAELFNATGPSLDYMEEHGAADFVQEMKDETIRRVTLNMPMYIDNDGNLMLRSTIASPAGSGWRTLTYPYLAGAAE